MNILVYLVVFCFCALLFIVGVYNSADATLNLILWQVGPAPLGAFLATAALFGMAFASIIGVIDGIKLRLANQKLRRQLQRAEEEVDALRLQLARHQGPAPAAAAAAPPAVPGP